MNVLYGFLINSSHSFLRERGNVPSFIHSACVVRIRILLNDVCDVKIIYCFPSFSLLDSLYATANNGSNMQARNMQAMGRSESVKGKGNMVSWDTWVADKVWVTRKFWVADKWVADK